MSQKISGSNRIFLIKHNSINRKNILVSQVSTDKQRLLGIMGNTEKVIVHCSSLLYYIFVGYYFFYGIDVKSHLSCRNHRGGCKSLI